MFYWKDCSNLWFIFHEIYVRDFGGSTAVGGRVAQVYFLTCHNIFILGVEERKAKRQEYTYNWKTEKKEKGQENKSIRKKERQTQWSEKEGN